MVKIAVIDDNQTFRLFVKQILELAGYEVALFVTADDFFAKEKELDTYALYIVDYNMPGMSGITALENIKYNPMTKDIPVLFVTGEPERELVNTAIRYKVNDFLSKPIDPNLLVARVQKLISKR